MYLFKLAHEFVYKYECVILIECLDEDIQTYIEHLIALHDDFKTKFDDILSMELPPWIINPFDEMENVILQEELLELSTNEELKRFPRHISSKKVLVLKKGAD
ncbi:hypothetical protein ACJJTC_000748 [Scirpophaga incertulas]